MIIYLTTNLINGKKYLGKDSKNNPLYLGSGTSLLLSIKKYGRENFKKEILEYCEDLKELSLREEYWLNFYKVSSDNNFYNRTEYARGGGKRSIETKLKISQSNKGRKDSESTKILKSKPKSNKHKLNMSQSKSNKPSNRCKEVIQYRYEIIKIPLKTFSSTKEAERELGIKGSDISQVCNGKQKTAGGFMWEFKKDKF